MSKKVNSDQIILEGRIALKEKDYQKSIEFFKEALMTDSENTEVIGLLGLSFYNKAEYQEAINVLEKISENKQTDYSYWNLLGNSYCKLRYYKKALLAYKKVLQLDPDSDTIETVVAHIENLILKVDYSEFENGLEH